jgi:hypothetical protein
MNIEVFNGPQKQVSPENIEIIRPPIGAEGFYVFSGVGYTFEKWHIEIDRFAPVGFNYSMALDKFEGAHEIFRALSSSGVRVKASGFYNSWVEDGVESARIILGSRELIYRGPDRRVNWLSEMNRIGRSLSTKSALVLSTPTDELLKEHGFPVVLEPPCAEKIPSGFYFGCDSRMESGCFQIEVVSDTRMNIEAFVKSTKAPAARLINGSLIYVPNVEFSLNPDTCAIELSSSVKIGENEFAARFWDFGKAR